MIRDGANLCVGELQFPIRKTRLSLHLGPASRCSTMASALALTYCCHYGGAKPVGAGASAIDSEARTIWIADHNRGDGNHFIVRADEKLTAFLELESAIHATKGQIEKDFCARE